MNRNVGMFIAGAFTPIQWAEVIAKPQNLKDKICGYCHRSRAVIAYKDVLRETLSERGIFFCEGFCTECAFAINYKIFLQKNFIVSGKQFQMFKHGEVWDNILIKEIPPPYFVSLTTSHKKHNIFDGEINYSISDERVLVFDRHLVRYSLVKDRPLFDAVYEEYVNYQQPKVAIMTGKLSVAILNEVQYFELRIIDKIISNYRGTILLKMIVDYVQKPKIVDEKGK